MSTERKQRHIASRVTKIHLEIAELTKQAEKAKHKLTVEKAAGKRAHLTKLAHNCSMAIVHLQERLKTLEAVFTAVEETAKPYLKSGIKYNGAKLV